MTREELRGLAWQLGHGEVGIDANAVSRHERGIIKRPRAPLPELYAVLYQTSVEALWPSAPHGTLDSVPEARRAQVRRRQLIRSAGGIAVAKKSETIARRVLAVRRWLDPKANAVQQLDQQLLTGWL